MHIDNFFLQGDVAHSGLPQWLAEANGFHGNSEESVQLTIWINSGGGDLIAAIEAINLMRASILPITTVINGSAESAALLIAIAGHRRLAFNTSWGMAHHFSTGVDGNYHELMDMVKHNKILDSAMYGIFENHTTMSDEQIYDIALGRKTTWLTPEEMLKLGMIDEIVGGPSAKGRILLQDKKKGK